MLTLRELVISYCAGNLTQELNRVELREPTTLLLPYDVSDMLPDSCTSIVSLQNDDAAIAQYVANQEQQKYHLSTGFNPMAYMTGYSSPLGAASYSSTAFGSASYGYPQKFH